MKKFTGSELLECSAFEEDDDDEEKGEKKL